MYYKSETYNISSTPKNGKVYGTRNKVEIANGKGQKIKEALDASGTVIERKSVALKKSEIDQILAGRFIDGLWSNCTLKNCTRRRGGKTRKMRH